jgi:flagellin-like protein
MKSLLRNKKALSPVVAAIILVAVTVAVSIAVAAWMGALTFTFTQTEELRITSVTFPASPANTTVINFANTGTNQLTIIAVTVDDAAATTSETLPLALDKGATDSITVTNFDWETGYKYTFALLSQAGNKYTYQATAVP